MVVTQVNNKVILCDEVGIPKFDFLKVTKKIATRYEEGVQFFVEECGERLYVDATHNELFVEENGKRVVIAEGCSLAWKVDKKIYIKVDCPNGLRICEVKVA